ncbi:MAG: prolipoprotein diacylglyceryl transferase [Opitutus sp.]|nr:prolipoprotein diacylglyceryl transferase [Opitutus sp.]
MTLALWLHNFSPFLIRFSENFGIRYYGLAYILGFVGAWALLRVYQQRGRSPLGADAVADLMTYLVLGVLIGGRVGYFFLYQMNTLGRDPLAIFRVWEGGMASHGGFVGVSCAIWWWGRRHQMPLWQLGDLVATVTPIGLLFGRVANFINGELPGKLTGVPWAVIFPHSEFVTPGTPFHQIPPRHPSQLYEAALEGALLLAFVQWRFWRTDVAQTKPGRLAGEFLIGYALVRAFCEHFREPDAPLMLGVSRGTFYSVFLIGAGLMLVMRRGPTRSDAAPNIS